VFLYIFILFFFDIHQYCAIKKTKKKWTTQFRDAHARPRCGLAQCSGIARACQPFDDANLYARNNRAVKESLRECSSACVFVVALASSTRHSAVLSTFSST